MKFTLARPLAIGDAGNLAEPEAVAGRPVDGAPGSRGSIRIQDLYHERLRAGLPPSPLCPAPDASASVSAHAVPAQTMPANAMTPIFSQRMDALLQRAAGAARFVNEPMVCVRCVIVLPC